MATAAAPCRHCCPNQVCCRLLGALIPWHPSLSIHPSLHCPPVSTNAAHRSLGALILANLDAQAAAGGQPSAAALVEELAETFPAFDDHGLCRGHQVRLAVPCMGAVTLTALQRTCCGCVAGRTCIRYVQWSPGSNTCTVDASQASHAVAASQVAAAFQQCSVHASWAHPPC